jgi:GxxExxY protein
MEYLHSELTQDIIKVFFKVYNTLGFGFLEKVYERALIIELRKQGFNVKSQYPITVYYEGQEVGVFYADIIVNELVILELKAIELIVPENEAQLINYLRATKIEVGLLLNFGQKPQIRRLVFTNDLKKKATDKTD